MDARLDDLINRFIWAQNYVIKFITIELTIDLPKIPIAGHVCRKPKNQEKLVMAGVEVFPHLSPRKGLNPSAGTLLWLQA
jgi:hypothetical protein